ncbi:hypothetical protein JSQ81_13385 [Sporosarcina sp. Marseille-Q4063]|nr:hypothetical protein JSQ81_13385 [Sporosarcina sp. Marseille-Q4063]
MLKNLSESDFMVLRKPLQSGRQSPGSLGAVLFLSIFLQALLLFLEYYIGGYSVYPNQKKVFSVHLWMSSILAVLSLIYAFSFIYMKSQKNQYLLGIIVSQNLFGVSTFILALFILGTGETGVKADAKSLLTFTCVTLLFGVLFFIATSIRFYILLQRGHFRIGSKKDELRERFETKSYLPIVIVASTGFLFIMQHLFKTFELADIEIMFMIVLAMIIYFTMIFVLPEQLVILYCKFRFDSLNYSKKGRLKPFNSRRKNVRN